MRIRFENLTLENFAIYPFVEVDFSVDEGKPLTLIRGENNSGKTTLMRAFVWMLFGEEFVPAIADSTHPIRPAWAGDEDILTTGELRFQVEQSKDQLVTYKLIRRGRTRFQGGKVSYDNDELNLYRAEPGEGFVNGNDRLGTLQQRYFPAGMREFILIDADKAEQLVGGTAADHNVQLMRESTTTAVRSLLGVEPMERVGQRVREIATKAVSAAAKSSGDRDLEKLAAEEDRAKERLEVHEEKVQVLEDALATLDAELANSKVTRDAQLQEYEALSKIGDGISKAERERTELIGRKKQGIATLSGLLKSEQCMATLMAPLLADVVRTLDPLKEEGRIPASEIALLPRLLAEDRCLCGIKFSEHPDRKSEVERRIEVSAPQRVQANFGDQCLEEARSMINRALGPGALNWSDQVAEVRENLGAIDQQLSAIDQEIERLEKELSAKGKGEAEVLGEIIRNHDTLLSQRAEKQRELETARGLLATMRSDHRSASEKLRLAKTKSASLVKAQNTAKIAEVLAAVIDDARAIIESQQVERIDAAVDAMFKDVVGVAEDSLYEHVGIRLVEGRDDQYEPYALGHGGVDKPISIMNGASRRAVSTSIVVALSEVTGTSIPFVADSLLHATSGAVKLRLVDHLTSGKQVGQPILFATRDDILGSAIDEAGTTVLDIVSDRAGVTYTVTSQAEVGGDVVRRDPNALHTQQSVICRCGADEYCAVCERVGDTKAKHLRARKGA